MHVGALYLLIFPFSPFCLLDSSSASCFFLFSALAACSLLVLFSWKHESRDVTHTRQAHKVHCNLSGYLSDRNVEHLSQQKTFFSGIHHRYTRDKDLTIMPNTTADLQSFNEKSPEGLDGSKKFLEGQLIAVLAQVESQLAPLFLQCSEPFT